METIFCWIPHDLLQDFVGFLQDSRDFPQDIRDFRRNDRETLLRSEASSQIRWNLWGSLASNLKR